MDGKVITANANFLKTLGYAVAKEVQGKHHGMFVEAGERSSLAYREFLAKRIEASLNRPNTNVSARMATRSGFRLPTIRYRIRPENPQELSNSPPIIIAKKIEVLENASDRRY